jgi:hypothetical protein
LQRFRCLGCWRGDNALAGTPLVRLRKKGNAGSPTCNASLNRAHQLFGLAEDLGCATPDDAADLLRAAARLVAGLPK